MSLRERFLKRPMMKRLFSQKGARKATFVECKDGECHITLDDDSIYKCAQVVFKEFEILSELTLNNGVAHLREPAVCDLDTGTTFIFGEDESWLNEGY